MSAARRSYDRFDGFDEEPGEPEELEMEQLPLGDDDEDEPPHPLFPLGTRLGAAAEPMPCDGFAGHISAQVQTSAPLMLPFQADLIPGSRFLRFWAKLFDSILTIGLFGGLAIWWMTGMKDEKVPLAAFLLVIFGGFGAWLTWFFYNTLMVGLTGTTVGKRLLGLKVVDEAGEKPGLIRAFARSWVEVFSALLLGTGYLFAFLDEKKRTLHDHLSGTRVVLRR